VRWSQDHDKTAPHVHQGPDFEQLTQRGPMLDDRFDHACGPLDLRDAGVPWALSSGRPFHDARYGRMRQEGANGSLEARSTPRTVRVVTDGLTKNVHGVAASDASFKRVVLRRRVDLKGPSWTGRTLLTPFGLPRSMWLLWLMWWMLFLSERSREERTPQRCTTWVFSDTKGECLMVERHSIGKNSSPIASWIQQNVIDAAPQWMQLLRSALANVRTR
jgi:hypothetical protein